MGRLAASRVDQTRPGIRIRQVIHEPPTLAQMDRRFIEEEMTHEGRRTCWTNTRPDCTPRVWLRTTCACGRGMALVCETCDDVSCAAPEAGPRANTSESDARRGAVGVMAQLPIELREALRQTSGAERAGRRPARCYPAWCGQPAGRCPMSPARPDRDDRPPSPWPTSARRLLAWVEKRIETGEFLLLSRCCDRTDERKKATSAPGRWVWCDLDGAAGALGVVLAARCDRDRDGGRSPETGVIRRTTRC
jgi:hypothetical protein